jgi:hypothetical protein
MIGNLTTADFAKATRFYPSTTRWTSVWTTVSIEAFNVGRQDAYYDVVSHCGSIICITIGIGLH